MRFPIQQPFVGIVCRFRVTGGVWVPQLTRQLRVFGLGTVTQRRFDEGAIQIRVCRKGHEGVVIHRTHRLVRVEVWSITFCHHRSLEQVLAGSRLSSINPGSKNSMGPPESREAIGRCSNHCPASMLVCDDGTLKISSSL